MKINKIKYNKEEVLDLMDEQKNDYEIIIGEQKSVIQRLKADIRKLSAELESYKNRENLIMLTLRSSEEKAEEIRRQSELEYAAELRRMSELKARWNGLFAGIEKKFPHHFAVRKSETLLKRIDEILGGNGTAKEKFNGLSDALKGYSAPFDPKEKVERYLDGVEEETACTIDLNEVLNPGELDLEELCKEMGLMEK